jgi:hypothetical protein
MNWEYRYRYGAMDKDDFDQAWGNTPQPTYTMPHYQNEDQEQQKWNNYANGKSPEPISLQYHKQYHVGKMYHPTCIHCNED